MPRSHSTPDNPGVAVAVGLIFLIYITYDAKYDDARLALLQSSYFYDNNRLVVNIILTDSNGDYTKANGNAEITVLKDGHMVYSNEYNFVKDDFVTWRNAISGEKITAYRIDIKQYFSSGSHDVFVDLNTRSGHWEDLHDSFYSLE